MGLMITKKFTLVGSPQSKDYFSDHNIRPGAIGLKNDHASNTISVAIEGALGDGTVDVLPGEYVKISGEFSKITADGTGTLRTFACQAIDDLPDLDQKTVNMAFGAGTVSTAALADASVTEDKLAASVAGSGLAGGAGSPLSVNVDGTGIEINADTLRLKDKGTTGAKRSLEGSAALAAGADTVTGSLGVPVSLPFATKTTIPANRLLAGTRIRLKASAVVTDGADTSTLQVIPGLGATALGSGNTALDVATNDTVHVEVEAVIRTTGAAGKFASNCDIYVGREGAVEKKKSVVVDGAIDTTADKDVTLLVNWGAGAAGGDDLDLVNWSVEVEN